MSLCLVDIHGDIEGDYDIIADLPRNATNGDVIKALFPNSEAIFVLTNVAKTDVIQIKNEAFLVERKWWNAPYERR